MAWVLIIHKSQALNLEHATIGIRNMERQRLTFIAIPSFISIDALRTLSPFSFENFDKMKNSDFFTIMKKGKNY